MKRGAWNMSSGPVGLTLSHDVTEDEHDAVTDNCTDAEATECTPRSRAMHKEELTYLNSIDIRFCSTGTSAVDTSAGLLRGRKYGGTALLWNTSDGGGPRK
ncbi:unnamed protein product, partial [Iphiclides podalirius]